MRFFAGLKRRFQNRSPTGTRFQLMQEYNSNYIWDGNLYDSDIVRAAIRPKVKAIGKLVAKHIRTTVRESGSPDIAVNPDPYIRFLLQEPNPFMTGQKFQEKMETQLILSGNAFALIARDENGLPNAIYPINATSVEALYRDDGLYLRFAMLNGKLFTFRYEDIIHLRGDFGPDNDLFGTSPAPALAQLMEIVGTVDKGIVKAIKNSSVIRWLLTFTSNMRPEDLQNETARFAENFLSTEKGVGVAGVDSKAEAKQIDPKDYVPNAAQTDRNTKRIYSFFNTNDKIVTSSYNEDEWNAYYESEVEPDVIQWSGEMTRRLFSRRQRGFGNEITYEAANLATASMQTKLGLKEMVDRGAMTPNEWRRVLNIAPVAGGDLPVRRLDTAPVKEVKPSGEN